MSTVHLRNKQLHHRKLVFIPGWAVGLAFPPKTLQARLMFPRFLRDWSGLILLAASLGGLCAQTQSDSSRWEHEIWTFEASDRTNPPPRDGFLFIGSSSFRLWKTMAQDFPGKPVINRGFGGSEIADSTAFASRIIFPYHPRMILLYAGDNDLAQGKSSEQVVADYRAFVRTVREQLPKTQIAFVSIKPSPSRWRLKDKIHEVNQQIAAMQDQGLLFIDVYQSMLGPDGNPREDLFMPDRLHPNAKCYQLWASLIGPYLK
jgi:lysophospholipase L1-like esterase